jgi:hypothetical protein
MEALTPEEQDAQFPILLPAMCLNRYYVAEGVRLYSQQTWAQVMGDRGRAETAKYAPKVLPGLEPPPSPFPIFQAPSQQLQDIPLFCLDFPQRLDER